MVERIVLIKCVASYLCVVSCNELNRLMLIVEHL
jgi:hypothetical protein